MRCAIELFFDTKTEKSIQTFIRKLGRERITSYLLDVGSRPHLALSVFETDQVEAVGKVLRLFARKTKRFGLDRTK